MHSTWPRKSLSFLSPIILMTSVERYNLWSYVSCRLLHYPITFGHKILRSDRHCSQTQSTVFPHCHKPNVTPTVMKLLCKHTHVYISTVMLSESRKKNKILWSCSEHYWKINILSVSSFCYLYFLTQLQNTSSSPTFQNFKQCII
jgi:hypothetical protein